MTYPPHPAAPKRGHSTGLVLLIIAGALVAVCAVAGVISAVAGRDEPEPAAPAPAAPSKVDVRPWLVEQGYDSRSWWSSLKAATWDGYTLRAETSLSPDADAQQPSVQICTALKAYVVNTGHGARVIQVLDKEGSVLASPGGSGSCAYRR